MNNITIAFNTANLVAHYTDYRFELKDWGKLAEAATQRTGPAEWAEICRKISACGYGAIEVWVALVDRCADDAVRAAEFKRIMQEHKLTGVSLGGPLNDRTAGLCKALSLPATCGGFWGSDKPTAIRVMRSSGILFNYENHPEKTIEEVRQQVDYGANGAAVALDTGWLVSQGIEAPKAVRELGRLIRHVHVKDVAAKGGHETVPLGEGLADIPGVMRELKAIGYEGVLSWEDEPENRNPFDIAAAMREYIQREWSRA